MSKLSIKGLAPISLPCGFKQKGYRKVVLSENYIVQTSPNSHEAMGRGVSVSADLEGFEAKVGQST